VESVALIVQRLESFVLTHPKVREIDLNPVIVCPRGQGAMALDALIVVE